MASEHLQPYAGTGKQFKVKFVGSECITRKKGEESKTIAHALESLRVAMLHLKSHKPKAVIGLNLHCLTMVDERSKAIMRFPLDKVFYVGHSPTDACYVGIMVAARDSHTGYKLLAFKAEQKVSASLVASANELFTLVYHMKKKQRSRSCGDKESLMTKEERRQKIINDWSKLDAQLDDAKKQLDLSPASNKPRPGKRLTAPADIVTASPRKPLPVPPMEPSIFDFNSLGAVFLSSPAQMPDSPTFSTYRKKEKNRSSSLGFIPSSLGDYPLGKIPKSASVDLSALRAMIPERPSDPPPLPPPPQPLAKKEGSKSLPLFHPPSASRSSTRLTSISETEGLPSHGDDDVAPGDFLDGRKGHDTSECQDQSQSGGNSPIFGFKSSGVLSSQSLHENLMLSNQDTFDPPCDVFETPVESNTVEDARGNQTTSSPPLDSFQVESVKNSLPNLTAGDGSSVAQADPCLGDVEYENIGSWHISPTSSSTAFLTSTGIHSEARAGTSDLDTFNAFIPLRNTACSLDVTTTNGTSAGFENAFDNAFDSSFSTVESSANGALSSRQESNTVISATRSPVVRDVNESGDLVQDPPSAIASDPWKLTLPAASGDDAGSAQVQCVDSDSQDEDDLFLFDPLKLRSGSSSSAPQVSGINTPQTTINAAIDELSDVFQSLPASAQSAAANSCQVIGPKIPLSSKEEASTASNILYNNTDKLLETKNVQVQEIAPLPKGVQKPIDVKEDKQVIGHHLTSQEDTSLDAEEDKPVPPLRNRSLLVLKSEQPPSVFSEQSLPYVSAVTPTDDCLTSPENYVDMSSFSLPPLPDMPDTLHVDQFSTPESKGAAGKQNSATLYYEPPPPPLPPKDPLSAHSAGVNDGIEEEYDDMSGGLINSGAQKEREDLDDYVPHEPQVQKEREDLDDYVPHEPQEKSANIEDYEEIIGMEKKNNKALENETYSTIVPLTSPSVQESATGSENAKLPPPPALPAISDTPVPSSIPQSSPSVDSTADATTDKRPSLDKKGATKEETKMLQKVEENRLKELKKQEKELKKREELKMKNRMKSMKNFKNFKLSSDTKPLFTVEVVEGRSKSKDHLAVGKGEQLSVFVTSHPKLPPGKLLVEKGDGTFGFVDKAITKQEQSTLLSTSGEIIEDDIYEKLDGLDLAAKPPTNSPLPNPTDLKGGKELDPFANLPPALPPPNPTHHREGFRVPDSTSKPPALPPRIPIQHDDVEVYDPTASAPPTLPPHHNTPQPDTSSRGNVLDSTYDDIIPARLSVSGEVKHEYGTTDYDDIIPTKLSVLGEVKHEYGTTDYDDIIPAKLSVSGEVRHVSGATDPPILPPKPDPSPPSLPPKPTQTTAEPPITTQTTSTVAGASTSVEKHEELSVPGPPLPPKPPEMDSSEQEFDMSLFTDFDESLPLSDLPDIGNLSTDKLTDLSLLSPPPESFLELPCLPEILELPALGITTDEVDKPAPAIPEVAVTDSSYPEHNIIQQSSIPDGSVDTSELPIASTAAATVAEYIEPRPSKPSVEEYCEVKPRDETSNVHSQAKNQSHQSGDISSTDSGTPMKSHTDLATSISKEEKKRLQKEEEKRQKELRKQEAMKEKEMKRKLEQRRRNRMKSQKTLKQFNLTEESKALFTVDVIEARPKGKEHLPVAKGERLSVFVATDAKLPPSKYLVEKEDGTLGFVDSSIVRKVVTEGEASSSDTASQEWIQGSTATTTLKADTEGIYEEVRSPDASMISSTTMSSSTSSTLCTLPPSNISKDPPPFPTSSNCSTQNVSQLPSSHTPQLPHPACSQSGESSGTS